MRTARRVGRRTTTILAVALTLAGGITTHVDADDPPLPVDPAALPVGPEWAPTARTTPLHLTQWRIDRLVDRGRVLATPKDAAFAFVTPYTKGFVQVAVFDGCGVYARPYTHAGTTLRTTGHRAGAAPWCLRPNPPRATSALSDILAGPARVTLRAGRSLTLTKGTSSVHAVVLPSSPLANTAWVLDAFTTPDGRAVPPPAPPTVPATGKYSAVAVTFGSWRITANDTCNTIGATYFVSGDRIVTVDDVSTARYCDWLRSDFRPWRARSATFTVNGHVLTVTAAEGTSTYRQVALPPS